MSEKVEQVARALYLVPLGGHEDPYAPRWDQLREKEKDSFRDSARAAIEAMRVPTEEMVKFGNDLLNSGVEPMHSRARDTWD